MTFPGRGAAFPCRREASSSWRRDASSGLCCSAEQGEQSICLAGMSQNPRENVGFSPYIKSSPRGYYDGGARRIPIAKTFTP
jgi:hypothetical protein